MVTKTRYFARGDDDGKTAAELRRLGRSRQIEYVIYWFRNLYEEPTHSPQSPPGDDGEPVYEWGGPYNALYEMDAEFTGVVPEKLIQEAAQQVERGSIFDWAPTPSHPDYLRHVQEWQEVEPQEPEEESTIEDYLRRIRGGEQPRYGSAREREARQLFRESLADLQRILDESDPESPGIGSNSSRFPEIGGIGAPPDFDTDTEAEFDAKSLGSKPTAVQAVATIDEITIELNKPVPDAEKVAKATSLLSRIGKWWIERAKKATEKVVESGMTFTAAGIAFSIVAHYAPGAPEAFNHAIAAALSWFNAQLP